MTNKEAIRNLENWKLFDKKIIEIDGDLGESIRLAIKALESEENLEQALSITEDNSAVVKENLTSDLISRSELKNHKFLTPDAVEAKKWLPEDTKAYQQGWNDAIDAIVDNAPAVDMWIPVSNRLPEDMQEVLVWFEYFRYGDYNCMYQTYGFGYVCDGKWSSFINGETGWQDARIIAWMPLPEPYKGADNE